jgi:hypothetical protein
MVLFCGPLAAAEADSLSFSGTNRRLAKEKMTNKLVIIVGIYPAVVGDTLTNLGTFWP